MVVNVNQMRARDAKWLHEHAGKVIVLSGGACERESMDITVKEIIKKR